MKVIKSNGNLENFSEEKIKNSIKKAFESVNIVDYNLDQLFNEFIKSLPKEDIISTKFIGDELEKFLIKKGYFEVAKKFITYRYSRHLDNKIYVIKNNLKLEEFNIDKIKRIFDMLNYDLNLSWEKLEKELKKYIRDGIYTKEIIDILVKCCINNISIDDINWYILAGRFILIDLYKKASKNLDVEIEKIYDPLTYLKLVKYYIEKGLYFNFLNYYSEDELLDFAGYIDKKRDFSYGYTSMMMYKTRYLLNPYGVYELPQHMYLSIALYLGINEKKENRKDFIIKTYNYCSGGYISLPTPTLLNARTNFFQLSSCFKLNIDDDLRGIFHGIENIAQISKYGGGVGVYLGHIRSKGSSIREREKASGGVIPWIKIINDTALAVNQLGARAGAVSVTIDIWHRDILDFLELQTERGDIRQKAYDVFPAVSIPDLFMKRLIENKEWTLFDPYEVRHYIAEFLFKDIKYKKLHASSFDYLLEDENFVENNKNKFLYIHKKDGKIYVKIKGLEDYYGEEFEKLYLRLEEQPLKLKKTINAKELFKQFLMTVVETGMPYVFFRDTANKLNPNNHVGMVYSTQLCTEIVQNTKQPLYYEEVQEDGKISIKYIPGELVTCNLLSINIAKVNGELIKEVIPIAMRILDNVIDLNFYPIQEGKITASEYRPVGLGFMGLAEYLAKNKKRYDDKNILDEIDELFETYAYWVLKSSVDLAKERGKYKYFDGSQRSKGILFGKDINWFIKNSKYSSNWLALIEDIKKYGLRFGYHQAPAPNTSTSLVVGTTAGVLPIYRRYFIETNSKGIFVNIAPNLSKDNYWYYKEYIHMKIPDVIEVISRIQKWIDQSISFEWVFNPMETSPLDLFNRYILVWQKGLKTIYYVRSMSLEVEKCESCSG